MLNNSPCYEKLKTELFYEPGMFQADLILKILIPWLILFRYHNESQLIA